MAKAWLCSSSSAILDVNHLLIRSGHSSIDSGTTVLSRIRDGTQGLEVRR